jgi:hypothetical protein
MGERRETLGRRSFSPIPPDRVGGVRTQDGRNKAATLQGTLAHGKPGEGQGVRTSTAPVRLAARPSRGCYLTFSLSHSFPNATVGRKLPSASTLACAAGLPEMSSVLPLARFLTSLHRLLYGEEGG